MNTPNFFFQRIILLAFVCGLCAPQAWAQSARNPVANPTENTRETRFPFVWYNVENLFDTINNPAVDDADFLPDGKMNWTGARYHTKQDSLVSMFQMLAAANDGMPAFFGVCEIENRWVLEDLTARFPKGSPQYRWVHYDCAYHRGMDVALAYDPQRITYVESRSLPVTFPFDTRTSTRDILYTLVRIRGEELALYMNHWPSRRQDSTYRIHTAKVLRQHLDSLQAARPGIKVMMLGDWNDDPTSPSLIQGLRAQPVTGYVDGPQPDSLYNLSEYLVQQGKYTFIYRDQKNMLDQCVVSGTLLQAPRGLRMTHKQLFVFDHDRAHSFVNNNKYIHRTYLGNRYLGGYADHLPLYGYLIFGDN